MRRRQFLGLTAAAASLAMLPQCAARQGTSPGRARLVSQAGQLAFDLTAAATSVSLAGRQAQLLSYNGQVPGPLLEAWAGDEMAIRFTNRLNAPTNLHYHGLHIPPTGQADNVFRAVQPGETAQYRFTLPPQHPSGLFWYHPHYHGRVAEQVFGGLAGPLIVRGALDEIPEIQAAQEEILVLQDFDLDQRRRVRSPMPMWRRWGRQGNLLTVNGDRAPQFQVPRQGLLRLRLLNASASRIYRLALENHPWYLIATDGGALAAPVELDELMLAPGERADVLVPGRRAPERYRLLSLPYDRGLMAMMGGMGPGMGPGMPGHGHRGGMPGDPMGNETTVLAHITYGETAAAPVSLPDRLIPVESLPTPARSRQFVLDHGMGAQPGQFFLINGQAFDPERIDMTVRLGQVEDWRLINRSGMDHPFHLHTNAFQVLRRNGTPEPYRAWKDVVNVRAYETVDVRVAFTDFPGKTVYHCHILDHEDQGMMGILDMQTATASSAPTASDRPG